MKIATSILIIVAIAAHSPLSAQTGLSKEDRKAAIKSLRQSKSQLFKAVRGLSENQLNYKPDPKSWTIAEVMEHIVVSEESIFSLIGMSMKATPTEEDRKAERVTDEQVIAFITDRSTKTETRPNLEPHNNYGSFKGTTAKIKALRKANMKYVKKTTDDLRNHYFEFPFGKVDAYQIVLFMSGHMMRHTAHINEIKADANFPAK